MGFGSRALTLSVYSRDALARSSAREREHQSPLVLAHQAWHWPTKPLCPSGMLFCPLRAGTTSLPRASMRGRRPFRRDRRLAPELRRFPCTVVMLLPAPHRGSASTRALWYWPTKPGTGPPSLCALLV